tara:strand:- start:1277 stop:1963 length:687 start_codon:yes stop_codon:yes gene_type:complete
MPTINVNRQGRAQGFSSSSFSTARTGNAQTVVDSPGDDQLNVVQYFKSTGRGGGTIRFKRVFLHFDTSSITSTLSAAHIDVNGTLFNTAANPNDTILIKSTAFGGDGGTALATTDFSSSLDYNTPYSSELTLWTTGNNEYTLNSDALADIKNNNDFTVAIISHDHDFLNTEGSGNIADDINIAFGTTITLDYTIAPTGYSNGVYFVASANIGEVNGVATANIDEIIGV